MKPINDLIKVDDPQSSIGHTQPQPSERERAKQERVFDRLWVRLLEVYGHQLNSQYGETIPQSWEELLTGLTPEQIKHGLESLVTRKETWPPNAIEFRQLCLPTTISPDGTGSTAYLHFNDPAHPSNDPKQEGGAYNAKRLTDTNPERVSKRKQSGNNELSKLKDMF